LKKPELFEGGPFFLASSDASKERKVDKTHRDPFDVPFMRARSHSSWLEDD
jgi:hypothetical protein